jgi:hypothetical protein
VQKELREHLISEVVREEASTVTKQKREGDEDDGAQYQIEISEFSFLLAKAEKDGDGDELHSVNEIYQVIVGE